jgi:hypothetical protein
MRVCCATVNRKRCREQGRTGARSSTEPPEPEAQAPAPEVKEEEEEEAGQEEGEAGRGTKEEPGLALASAHPHELCLLAIGNAEGVPQDNCCYLIQHLQDQKKRCRSQSKKKWRKKKKWKALMNTFLAALWSFNSISFFVLKCRRSVAGSHNF